MKSRVASTGGSARSFEKYSSIVGLLEHGAFGVSLTGYFGFLSLCSVADLPGLPVLLADLLGHPLGHVLALLPGHVLAHLVRVLAGTLPGHLVALGAGQALARSVQHGADHLAAEGAGDLRDE